MVSIAPPLRLVGPDKTQTVPTLGQRGIVATDKPCRSAWGMTNTPIPSPPDEPTDPQAQRPKRNRKPKAKRRSANYRPKDGQYQSIEEMPAEQRAPAESELNELRCLVEADQQWRKGDLVNSLLKRGLSYRAIAELVGIPKSSAERFSKVAAGYPSEDDRRGVEWSEAAEAWRQSNKKGRGEDAPELVRKAMAKSAATGKRVSVRGIIRDEHEEAIAGANKRNKAEADDLLAKHPELGNRFYLGRCEQLVNRLADCSVKVFHADPLYSNYFKLKSGELDTADSYNAANRTAVFRQTREEAIEGVIQLLDRCRSKLVPGGCFLLWQAGGRSIAWEIGKAMEEYGWVDRYEVPWYKGNTQATDFSEPYSSCTEKLLVCYRRKDVESGLAPKDHMPGGKLRKDLWTDETEAEFFEKAKGGIICSQPTTRDFARAIKAKSASPGDSHVMMKPAWINELLVRKHSFEGDLCVDLFGCSGSYCAAAAQLGRRWVYMEALPENYYWGVSRLSKYLPPESNMATG